MPGKPQASQTPLCCSGSGLGKTHTDVPIGSPHVGQRSSLWWQECPEDNKEIKTVDMRKARDNGKRQGTPCWLKMSIGGGERSPWFLSVGSYFQIFIKDPILIDSYCMKANCGEKKSDTLQTRDLYLSTIAWLVRGAMCNIFRFIWPKTTNKQEQNVKGQMYWCTLCQECLILYCSNRLPSEDSILYKSTSICPVFP